MQIHELSIKGKKDRKRVGRGGKRGTYSGRGTKGQKSRSGSKIDPLFEGGRSSLVERMKKSRGVKSIHLKKITLTTEKLESHYEGGETVSIETLLAKKILTKKNERNGVKIVFKGKLSKNLVIGSEILLSQNAHDSILEAGGKVEEIQESSK
ncbi:MAG: 50S ribosomal protein L15 [Candidatus Moraniibacteriota bacterium]|nr:MAG: 50S ribosomal protein L15 [Candidatus Moranbacteria bacterium]